MRSGLRCHSGMVLDASSNGVFVQTSASFPPGCELDLTVHVPRNQVFALRGRVARVVVAPPGLKPGAGCGLGVALTQISGDYLAWVESLAGERGEPLRVSGDDAVRTTGIEPPLRSFRVRMKHTAANRTRLVLVRCSSESEATELALAEFDADWKVSSVESG